MGTTTKDYVIYGIPFSAVAEIQNVSFEYPIYDQRTGEYTGKMGINPEYILRDKTGRQRHTGLGKSPEIETGIEAWDIEEVYAKDGIGIFINHELEGEDRYILGKILSVHSGYDSVNTPITMDEITDADKEVHDYLKERFNYNGYKRFFHVRYVSY